MKTTSFIGSDKNAGKTTVLNFVYRRLCETISGERTICLTSVGINGEDVDSFNNRLKPKIAIVKGSCFITEIEHLKGKSGKYDTLYDFKRAGFKKHYLLVRSLQNFETVMEGPNNKESVLAMKHKVETILPNCRFMIDGSIDRQFLAHPQISDELYFSVVATSCREQLRNAQDLLSALSIPECPVKLKQLLETVIEKDTKSLLLMRDGTLLYHGKRIPFLDEELKKVCIDHREEECDLYLNGALSKSLYTFLSRFENLMIVVDNFTLYRNIGVHQPPGSTFEPDLVLLRVVPVKKIFLKQETETCSLKFPENVDVHDLFKEDTHLIKL